MCCSPSPPVKRENARISYRSQSTILCIFVSFLFIFTPHPFQSPPICLRLSLILLSLHVCLLISLPSSKCILTCPCTITKPACLFMLHRGITLFLLHYFSVKLPRSDLPQTALYYPTLIIFSHSTTPWHNDTHTHTFPSQVCVCVC